MSIGANVVFRPDVGRRDPRGFGIVLTLWAAVGVARLGIDPGQVVQVFGAAIVLLALVLYQWAAVSIRGRVFSFAGNDDLPQFVHTAGPYAYVRNPFYLSYLLVEVGTVVMWPGAWGAAVLLAAVVYFEWLARYEEAKLARSPVAADYAAYKAATGRLIPRMR